MSRELLLNRNDIREIRPKCDICGQDLTYVEFLLLENRCVFHCGDTKPLKSLTMLKYLRLLMGDLFISRRKLQMKERGLDERDYAACVGTVRPSLEDIVDEKDMEKLLRAMDKHTGEVA